MNIKECKNRLMKIIKGGFTELATMLWGASGIGKTTIILSIGNELSLPVIMLSLNKMSPVDIMGVPFYDKETGKTVWGVPSIYPDEKRDGKSGILFIDEINTAAPSVQAAAYQLILDRKVGNYSLPKGWFIIAAGNRSKDKGVTFKMAAPLNNRFAMHMTVEPSIEIWTEWAYKHAINPSVIGFLNWQPEYLHKQPEELEDGKGFPTPRSWESVSKLLSIYDGEEALDAIADCVGEGVAAEFASYMKVYQQLPDTEAILSGKITKCELDKTNASLMYAISTSIFSNIFKNFTFDRVNNGMGYLNQLEVSYVYLAARYLLEKNTELTMKTPNFKAFIDKHKDVILAS